jgi:polyisoprenoid-binding protein YceI
VSIRSKAYLPLVLSGALLAGAGLLTLAPLASRPAAAAAAPSWSVDKAASHLKVDGVITQSDTKFTGEFKDWTANIAFDPQNLAASSVQVTVQMLSFESDYAEATEFFPEPDWSFAADFPRATFTSTSFKDLGGGKYEAAGLLKIKNVEKPIVLPFTLAVTGDSAKMSGQVEIDRTDFTLGAGHYADEATVAKKTVVKVEVTAKRA